MNKCSPLAPRRTVDKYDGLRSMGPMFRTGNMSVRNAKPNRNPINPNLFTVEAAVPFHHSGPDRKSLDRKRAKDGRYVEDTRLIGTPRKNKNARRKCWWVAVTE